MSRVIVSVIVPVYNSEKYLEKCIKSILGQKLKCFELIIVNDGSTDDSKSICTKYAAQDERVLYIETENRGVSAARNTGIEHASGEYIAFVDSDDYVSDDYLYVLYKEASKYPQYLAACDVEKNGQSCAKCLCSSEKMILNRQEAAFTLINNTISGFPVNKLFNRKIIDFNQVRFSEEIYLCEDLLFCAQYLLLTEGIRYINMPLYFYEVHEESSSNGKSMDGRCVTVLKAYDKLAEILINYKNCEEELRRQYYVMCVRMWKLVVVDKKNEDWRKNVLLRIKSIPFSFIWDKTVSIKYRFTWLIARLTSGVQSVPRRW